MNSYGICKTASFLGSGFFDGSGEEKSPYGEQEVLAMHRQESGKGRPEATLVGLRLVRDDCF